MADSAGKSSPLLRATTIGTVLQLVMVVAGHFIPAIKNQFAMGGTGISAVAELLYALWAGSTSTVGAIRGGAVAGGVSAFLGIVVSCLLKDVGPIVLAIGTAASTVGGLLGGLVGRYLNKAPT